MYILTLGTKHQKVVNGETILSILLRNATKLDDDVICSTLFTIFFHLTQLQALPDGISSSPTPPSLPPVRDGTLEAIDEENAPCGNSMTMTDKLRDFCRFQPKDHVGCAKKVR